MIPAALPVRTATEPGDMSFQQLMAERLQKAPWLALSAALHLVAAVLLWLLIPPEVKQQLQKLVQVCTTEPLAVEPPPEIVPPETLPEPTTESASVSDTEFLEPTEATSDTPEPSDATAIDAFPTDSMSSPIGICAGPKGPYGDRKGRGPRGSGRSVQPAIDAALQWLVRHQDADGKWDCDGFMKHDDPAGPGCDGAGNAVHDVGVTGLALLAFLGDGSTLRGGTYQPQIKKAVAWLRAQQQPNGLFGTATSHDFIYDHAIAAYAMCEAFGLSDSQLLRPSAQKALDYLEAHRNPYGVWRYQPRDGDNDTSITGWCIMAYEAGRHFGLTVNTGALKLAANWLDSVSDASGRHGYGAAGQPSSRKPGNHAARFPPARGEAMTAVGLFCRFFLGQDPKDHPVMAAAAKLLLQKPPVWDDAGGVDHYYWYYGTYALFQMGGQGWHKWQQRLEPTLLQHQHRDQARGNLHGSWDPACAWGEDGGRVYSTAILALTLEANFRYSRLVR